MAASTPNVRKFHPLLREGHSVTFGPTPSSEWVDSLVLVAGTAKSYTLPTGTDPAGGAFTNSGPAAPAGGLVSARILRVTANGGPIYVDVNGNTAAVPTADNLTGNGPVIIPPGLPYFLTIPYALQPVSFYADQATVVAIEVWW